MSPNDSAASKTRTALALLRESVDLAAPSPEDVAACVGSLACPVPPSYRELLVSAECVDIPRLSVNGVGRADAPTFSVLDAQMVAVTLQPGARDLLPLKIRQDGYWICLDMRGVAKGDEGTVRVFELDTHRAMTPVTTLATDFGTWFLEQTSAWAFNEAVAEQQMPSFREHLSATAAAGTLDHTGKGVPPKAHDWHPRIGRTQDVRHAQWVWRFDRMTDLIEVDVFMAADVPELQPLEAARSIVNFLGAEAARLGADVGIRFTSGEIPAQVIELGDQYGIVFTEGSGLIGRPVLRRLMLALADLPPDILPAGSGPAGAQAEWLVQLVRDNTWSASELAHVAVGGLPLSCIIAADVKSGRVPLAHAATLSRPAVALGLLERRLRARAPEPGEDPSILDDTERVIESTIGGPEGAWVFRGYEDFVIPWTAGAPTLAARQPLTVWAVTPTPSQYVHALARVLTDVRVSAFRRAAEGVAAVLVPADTAFADASVPAALDAVLSANGVLLLVGPLNQRALDDEFSARASQSRRAMGTWA